jgi:hypothetical protein
VCLPGLAVDNLRELRREHGGEYEITVIGGDFYAWRHDGTTATVRCGSAAGLRAAIAVNRRSRPRVPHPRSGQ